MNAQLENWDDLKYFLAVARAGGLSAAARELGVNHSTVFRRIGGLERSLGARLFERQGGGYQLTAVGEDMLAIATRIEDDVLALDRRIVGRDRELTGTVRVTTVEELAAVLAPDFKAFHDRFPGIDLEVNTEQRLLSLSRYEADIALRPGRRPTEPDLIGRKLTTTRSGFYASRDYLAAHGPPTDVAALADHWFVGPDASLDHIVTHRWLLEHVPGPHIAYRSNSMLGQLAGVKAGFGIGILPCFMCDREPDLVRLHPAEVDWPYGIWLIYHADLRQTARVRAFVELVDEAMERHADLFTGARSASPRAEPSRTPG